MDDGFGAVLDQVGQHGGGIGHGIGAVGDDERVVGVVLRTNLGERVMLPEFGTAAGEFLFSDSRAERIAALEESVREALEQWEPRIMDIDVQAARESSGGVLNINISYTLRATNNQFNMVYPFYMMEGEGR